jgi:hypothetical protein
MGKPLVAQMYWIGSGSGPVAGIDSSGVEPSDSAAREEESCVAV